MFGAHSLRYPDLNKTVDDDLHHAASTGWSDSLYFYKFFGLAFLKIMFPILKGVPGKTMLLAVEDLGLAACPPGFDVSLPLLLEILAAPGFVVLCSFHAAQYGASATTLPGGVKLTVTKFLPPLQHIISTDQSFPDQGDS